MLAELPEVIALAQRCGELEERLSAAGTTGSAALEVRARALESRLVVVSESLHSHEVAAAAVREDAGRLRTKLAEGRVGRALVQAERSGGIVRVTVEADVLLELRDGLARIAGSEPLPSID